MAKKSKTANRLDPAIWGELAAWGVVDTAPQLPTSEEAALTLLDRARELLQSVNWGERTGESAIDEWLDDLAAAAAHCGWWTPDFCDPDDAAPA